MEQRLLLARRHVEASEDDDAVRVCDEILAIEPQHPEALSLKKIASDRQNTVVIALRMADEAFNQGAYTASLAHYETAMKLRPWDETIRHKRTLSQILSQTDLSHYARLRLDERRPWIDPTIWQEEAVPSSVSVVVMGMLIVIGLVALTLQAYGWRSRQIAEGYYEAVRQQVINHGYLTHDTRRTYEKLLKEHGRTEAAQRAREVVTHAEARMQEQIRQWLRQGQEQFDQGRYQEAIAIWKQIVAVEPEHQEAQRLIQQAELWIMWQMRRRQAMTEPEPSALSHGPPAAATRVAEALPDTGLMIMPSEVQQRVIAGQRYFERGEYERAIREWELAMELDPEHTQSLRFVVEKTRVLAARSAERHAQWFAQAQRLEAAERFEEALVAYRQALTYFPSDPETQARIAALETWQTAGQLSLAPRGLGRRVASGVRALWWRLRRLQAPSEPAPTPAAADTTRTRRIRQWEDQAQIAEDRQQWRQANRYYRRIQAMRPDPQTARRMRLNALLARQQRLIEQRPDDAQAGLVMGAAFYQRGEFDRAVETWRRTLRWHGHRVAVKTVLQGVIAATWWEQGRIAEAERAYRDILAVADLYWVRASLAELLWQRGAYWEAVAMWRALVERYPEQLHPRAALAMALYLFDDLPRLEEQLAILDALPEEVVRHGQWVPPYADPSYYTGLVSPERYVARTASRCVQLYELLERPVDTLRWIGIRQAAGLGHAEEDGS